MKITSPDNEPVALEESCQVFVYNATLVEEIKRECLDLRAIAALFKTLSEESCCVILMSLCKGIELCVCNLSQISGLAMPTPSHYVHKLREQGLVASRHDGNLVFFRLEGDDAKTPLKVVTARERTQI